MFFCLIGLCFVNPAISATISYDSIELLVNEKPITKNEIDIRIFELARAKRMDLKTISFTGELRELAIKQLIEETLLDFKADELFIFLTDEELDKELERFRQQRKISQMEFESLLERQQISLADFRKTYKRQLRRNRVIIREIRSGIQVDEVVIKERYEKSVGTEKLVHARHILIALKTNAAEVDVLAAKDKAKKLKLRIEKGESFEAIAVKFSEDPSAKNNQGDLGFFKKPDMVAEFSEAAFLLEVGKISEPVRTPFGYHIIEVLEKKDEPKESFDKVKSKMMQAEFQKEFEKKYSDYVAKMKEKAIIIRK